MGGFGVKNTIIDKMVQIIAPRLCIKCQKEYDILCECCLNDIVNDPFMGCWRCDWPTFSGICSQHKDIPIDSFWVAALRKDEVKDLLDVYKFSSVKSASKAMAELLNYRLPVLPAETAIIPVPTKRSSLRSRGFDHTLLLAQELASLRGIQVAEIMSVGRSKVQHFLDKDERANQVKGIFKVIGDFDFSRPVLLLDDIVTTGATMLEVAEVLRQHGAKTVWATAVAKQPLD